MTSGTRRAIVIVGSLVALAIVLAMAVPAVGRIVQTTEEQSSPLPADLTHLTLDGDVGDIRLRAAAPDEEPRADMRITSSLSDPTAQVEVSGSRAELAGTCQSRWWDSCSIVWDVVVPADAEVVVTSSVGDVTITDLAGPLVTESSVGSVTATGLSSPTVQARSSVGDITLDLVAPPESVTASSSTGDVTLTVPDDTTAYRVQTTTSVGSITNEIGSDPSQDRSIDLRTSVGDITVRRG